MIPKEERLPENKINVFIHIGLNISIAIFLLLIAVYFSYLVYSLVSTSPSREILTLATFFFFIILTLSVFSLLQAQKRIKNIWNTVNTYIQRKDNEPLINYLYRRVSYSREKFDVDSKRLFKSIRIYKYTTVVLSIISTIVLGVNFDFLNNKENQLLYSIISKNIALVLNTIVTAISTLSAFWNLDKYWIQNKVIKHQLEQLRVDIEFEMHKNVTPADHVVEVFFQRHQAILKDFYLYWEGVLTDRQSSSNSPVTTKPPQEG